MINSQEEFVEDLKKYVQAVDESAVAGIVKHCSIALQSRDASLVATSERIRDSFLKRKLALTGSDEELDAA